MTNWQSHLEHLPTLPLLGYETFTWPEDNVAIKKIPSTFATSTWQTMYYNINSLMSGEDGVGGGGCGSSSSGYDYSTDIQVLHDIVDKLPVLPNPPSLSIT
jgi:hypothetical protein